jgi:hypothetical protein
LECIHMHVQIGFKVSDADGGRPKNKEFAGVCGDVAI